MSQFDIQRVEGHPNYFTQNPRDAFKINLYFNS